MPHHRAIEEAPQGVVADRDGTCDGDVPQAAPTRARENYQVGAVGVHRRGHAGQGAEEGLHNYILMTTKMTCNRVAARRGETGRFAPLLLPAVWSETSHGWSVRLEGFGAGSRPYRF